MAERRNWKPLFIEALRNSGNVRAACQAAAISRETAYKAKRDQPRFAEQWATAIEDAVDALVAVAWQRARTGVSDQVLMMLLKAHRPDLYGTKVQLNVTREEDIEAVMRARKVTREEAERAIAEAERLIENAR